MTLRSPRIPTIVNASTHRVAACLLAAAGLFSGCAWRAEHPLAARGDVPFAVEPWPSDGSSDVMLRGLEVGTIGLRNPISQCAIKVFISRCPRSFLNRPLASLNALATQRKVIAPSFQRLTLRV